VIRLLNEDSHVDSKGWEKVKENNITKKRVGSTKGGEN